MKVKVFKLTEQIGDFTQREVPSAAKVESTIQEWLDDNPNASIEHVSQTVIETTWVLVTIFYSD